MDIHIQAFGIAREIMGNKVDIRMEQGATAGDLKALLLSRYPPLGALTSFMIAVNDTYAAGDVPLGAGDEVAVIPPVSGG